MCIGGGIGGPPGGPPGAVVGPGGGLMGWGCTGPLSRGAASAGASFRGGPPYNPICYNFVTKLLCLWSNCLNNMSL